MEDSQLEEEEVVVATVGAAHDVHIMARAAHCAPSMEEGAVLVTAAVAAT